MACAAGDLDDLVHTYNNDLATALDKPAAVSQKKIFVRLNTQWSNS